MIKHNSITVIIPCRNEENNIANAIESVLKNDYPMELVEIFIYNGMSTDKSAEIIKSYTEKYPNIHLKTNVRMITPVAFNLGINESESEFIQIMGSRHELSENYLSTCIKILQNSTTIACVGGGANISYNNEIGELITLAMSSKFGVGIGNVHSLTKSSFTDTAGAPIFKKSIFNEVGLFDEELVRNQDDEMSYRITNAGYKIYTTIDTKAKYTVRNKINNVFKQYFQYGYWKVYVNVKHRTITTVRQIFPLLFVMFLFLFGISSCFLKVFPIYLIAILIYIVIATSSSKGNSLLQKLKITSIIFIIHLGYGLGYAEGILHFILLRRDPSENAKKLTR
jgi:cellulose synthase/poly-beta-1,6-N-acetylglucosamine synthase-like glycosyltransferase